MAYINGESVLAIGILFPILGIIAVCLRFYARKMTGQSGGVDDWLCIAALVLDVALGIVYIYGSCKHAIGYHDDSFWRGESTRSMYDLTRVVIFRKLLLVILLLSHITLALIKLSVLFLYRRIFAGRTFQLVNWAMIGLVMVWVMAFSITTLAGCGNQLSAYWSITQITDDRCVNLVAFNTASATSNAIIDMGILVLPLFWIWKLQMRLRQKIVVSMIFWLGGFAIFASWYRCALGILILQQDWGSAVRVFGSVSPYDHMGITSVPLFWTYIEIGTAMVGCCLPCLKPILDRLSIKAITSAFGTKLSSSGQGSKESSSYKMSNVKTPSDGGLPLNSESDTTALTLGPAKLGSGSVRHYAVGEAVQGDRDMHSERVGVRTEMNVYSEYV